MACAPNVVLANFPVLISLVDTDLRRPVMHRVFDVENTPGLTNLIVGDAKLDLLTIDGSGG